MSQVTRGVEPTFDLTVKVKLFGGKEMDVLVTYKYRSVEDFEKYLDDLRSKHVEGRSDAEVIGDIATNWDLEGGFDAGAIAARCNELPGLGAGVSRAYVAEYYRVRRGN